MEADPVAEDDIRIGAPADELRPGFDLPQLFEDPLVRGPADAEQPQRSLAREQVGEEELQQALVADVDAEIGLAQPLLETAASLAGQGVDGPRASAPRGSLTLDQPRRSEPAQLWIDLPVARIPEEPGRLVDRLLDLVAAARPKRS